MRLVGFSSVLFVALLGCAPTEVGDKCLQDSNCGVGFFCDHQIKCTTTADCIDGFVCNPQPGGGSICQQDDNQNGTIEGGETNLNTPEGVCSLVPCDVDTICPDGFSCNAATSFCEENAQ